jgi:L-ascorbate metabolism protein UlaG (beta-lactamase superfamily)
LLSTLIRNIQLIIHTISPAPTRTTPAPAVGVRACPITIPAIPATANPTGSHILVNVSILGPARYLADFARFVASKGSQERHDAQALSELETVALGLPLGLELEWLGVSGYRMSYQGQTIFIDPYVSRVPLAALIRRTPALPDAGLIDRYIGDPGTVAGVLVGHTHFDHAVDAPAIARRLRCRAYGSSSLTRLMALHGAADQAVEVEPYVTYELGPFTVSFVPSLHSKLVLGLAVPFDGELTCDHLDALGPGAYRCGQVWGIHIEVAGATFYHQGSANLLDDAIRHRGVDFFLAGVAGRGFTRDYWGRILSLLEPRTIVPTHYDDFFRPLASEMGFTTNVNLANVPDEVRAVSRDFQVAALPLLQGRAR